MGNPNLDADTIVIGSGAGGLTAAVALAQAGDKVIVLEQHELPGGWCHSFTLGGYRFSPGVHYVGELGPGGHMREIYEGLGVANDVTFFELNPDGLDHVRIGDQRFDIPRGKDLFADRMASRFSADAQGIRRYLDIVGRISDELNEAMELSRVRDMLTLPFRLPTTLRYGLYTLEHLLDRFVQDPVARAILSIQCGDYGVGPARAPAAMHAAITGHYYGGGFYPKGGGFTIPRAFIRALKREGGKLQVRAKVERILVEGTGRKRRAIGVRLADGTELRAERVVSNADPQVTYGRLIDEAHLSPRLRRRLPRTRWSLSALSLFMAVDMDLKAAGLDSGNYWFARGPEIDEGYRLDPDPKRLLEGDLPGIFLTATTLKDPTKLKRGHHTLEAFTFVSHDAFSAWADSEHGRRPDAYERLKARLTDKMLDTVDELVPGLKERVVFSDLGTPLTNEHYVEATRGSLYGIEKTRSQIGPFAYPVRSEIGGLTLCGASTVAHGVMGATVSGLVAASTILRCRPKELLRAAGQELKTYPSDDPTAWPESLRRKLPSSATEPQASVINE